MPVVPTADRRLLLDDADIRRVHGLHADHVIARIDVMDFTGDAARQVRQEVEAGIADFLGRDRALQRRVVFVPAQDVAEVANARSGQRLDRARRRSR